MLFWTSDKYKYKGFLTAQNWQFSKLLDIVLSFLHVLWKSQIIMFQIFDRKQDNMLFTVLSKSWANVCIEWGVPFV